MSRGSHGERVAIETTWLGVGRHAHLVGRSLCVDWLHLHAVGQGHVLVVSATDPVVELVRDGVHHVVQTRAQLPEIALGLLGNTLTGGVHELGLL